MELQKFSYTYKKSKRLKKNLKFFLLPENSSVVVVSIPFHMSVSSAQKVVAKSFENIEHSLQKHLLKQKREEFIFSKPDEILYLGRWYRKEYSDSVKSYKIDETVIFFNKSFTEGNFYRAEASKIFKEVVEKRLSETNLKIKKLYIRNQRTRWGTCSSRGNVSLNLKLVQAPISVIDYVAVHEIVHLEVAGHGREFWQRVQQLCPDYKGSKKYLSDNKNLLMYRL